MLRGNVYKKVPHGTSLGVVQDGAQHHRSPNALTWRSKLHVVCRRWCKQGRLAMGQKVSQNSRILRGLDRQSRRKRIYSIAAYGSSDTTEEATVFVRYLDMFVTVQLLEDTPAVLSKENSSSKMCIQMNGRKAKHQTVFVVFVNATISY